MSLNKKVQVIIYRRINEKIEFLILKTNKKRGGFFQPVTGKVEFKEDLLDAAKREVEEETGITKYLKIVEDFYSFKYPIPGRLKYKVSFKEFEEHVFAMEISPEDNIKISDEHEEYKWCNYNDAYDMIEFETNKYALKKLNFSLKKEIRN